jgi:hypothetical protein
MLKFLPHLQLQNYGKFPYILWFPFILIVFMHMLWGYLFQIFINLWGHSKKYAQLKKELFL